VIPAVLSAVVKETQYVWESEHLQHWIQKKLFPFTDKYSYRLNMRPSMYTTGLSIMIGFAVTPTYFSFIRPSLWKSY